MPICGVLYVKQIKLINNVIRIIIEKILLHLNLLTIKIYATNSPEYCRNKK